MRKIFLSSALFFILTSFLFSQQKEVKNIIIMIPDGTSSTVLSLARWYQNGELHAIDPHLCGYVRTHSSDAPIGDSAPTGSTYATGYLSQTGYVSTYPPKTENDLVEVDQNRELQPLFTILEAAKMQNKATGLVFTCYLPHATPAAFASHYPRRWDYSILSKQMVFNRIDFVAGGGYDYLRNRSDSVDLTKTLTQNRYTYTESKDEFMNFRGDKMWALFTPKGMANDIDRDKDKEPSLAEMTQKSIEVLSKNRNGFFLMVEGSKVDWSAHDNDPVGVITEFLAFDKAVGVAIDFAKKDGNTAVIVVPDHGNGGVAFGGPQTNSGYDRKTQSELFDNLRNAKRTAEYFGNVIKEKPTKEEVKKFFKEFYGIEDLVESEINSVQGYYDYEKRYKAGEIKENPLNIRRTVAQILTNRSPIGWTTTGHTGEDVFLAVYHPQNYRPMGLVQNSDVNKYMQEIFGIESLDFYTEKYYAPASEVFKGMEMKIDSINPHEPVLVVKHKKMELHIPAHKNEAWLIVKPKKNREIINLQTPAVQNKRDFFVPRDLGELMKMKNLKK